MTNDARRETYKPPFFTSCGRYGVKPHLKHQHTLINEGSWGGGSGISNNVDSQKNNHSRKTNFWLFQLQAHTDSDFE